MPTLLEQKVTRQNLPALLDGDLEFHGASSSYASHSLHAFAAKFPPQLPRLFIEQLTDPGDIVLDPMVGSGTTVVEAHLLGRRGIGVDIDPLALLIGKVKTTALSSRMALEAGQRVLQRAAPLLADQKQITRFLQDLTDENRKFIDYWFTPDTQRDLAALILAIEEEGGQARDFLHLVFSSIIITKSGGVSLARDLAHSRPHLDQNKTPRNALDQYRSRLLKSAKALDELDLHHNGIEMKHGDCRRLPVEADSVHLIVTSPPYANAIDYMRAHKFSLVWLGQSLSFLSKLRNEYIGSEQVSALSHVSLPPTTTVTISTLESRDARKAKILRKYFADMRAAMSEMCRVLKPGRAAIIVVGSSTMRGLKIETATCLAELGVDLGFNLMGIRERRLDRNRRMMPARFQNNGQSLIEQRMHEEHVIAFLKP